MKDPVDVRWKSGVAHHPDSIKLIKLMQQLDVNDKLADVLKLGGDGDMGEDLAYYLDELIESNVVQLKITATL